MKTNTSKRSKINVSITCFPFVLITVFPMIALMVSIMVTVVIVRATHAKRQLDGHLLPAKLHGVDQIVND